jgi:hypothetical protein
MLNFWGTTKSFIKLFAYVSILVFAFEKSYAQANNGARYTYRSIANVDWRQYDHLDPKRLVPEQPFIMAIEFFDKFKNRIDNRDFLTIVDFSQHSRYKRMYLIDMRTGQVERFVVSHGKGSEPVKNGEATQFSNVENSFMSSLGFYLTEPDTYVGKWGTSLRIQGLEKTNNLAMKRAIVIHGADYVEAGRDRTGNSEGCFALELSKIKDVTSKIAGRSLIFAYTKPELIDNPNLNLDYLKKFDPQP